MLLTINAPEIERRLQQEADKQGVTAADLALRLLETQLATPSQLSAEERARLDRPFHATATQEEWRQGFLDFVGSHNGMNLPQLPPQAFERESFYEDERHRGGTAPLAASFPGRPS
jgi:hypothetical protein